MINRIFIIVMLISVMFSGVANSESLLAQENFVKKVIVSIKTEPHLWFSTGGYLVYAETRDDVKIIKEMSYPKHSDLTTVVISFNFGSSSNYVKIIKPLDSFIKGKPGAELLIEIKIFILKDLQRDVGKLLEARSKPKQTPEPIPKPETKDDEPEKL